MKVIINTTDGKAGVIKEEVNKDKDDILVTRSAVIQVGKTRLMFDPNELYRAVNAMWGQDRETYLEM